MPEKFCHKFYHSDMIRTVILGADTPDAGELIRILSMHPDIELVCAQAYGKEGRALTSQHHGLIGETDLTFTTVPAPAKCNVVLDFSEHGEPAIVSKLAAAFPEAMFIRLDRCQAPDDGNGWVYGLPEINRKALVRGARFAAVPNSFASMALVALYPLALHLLLNSDITLDIEAPQDIIDETDIPAIEREITRQLGLAQTSFKGNVTVRTSLSNTRRTASLHLDLPCSLSLDELLRIYGMYEDHHFAFPVMMPVGPSEVAGTDKCVISLSKPDPDTLHIDASADCRMRGAAGEAVHILNLMCGLHERTGLALKAIDFHPI